MDAIPHLSVAAFVLAGVVALLLAVRFSVRPRRPDGLGPVSGEWLSYQKVRDRRTGDNP